MRILVEITHPAQVHFFKNAIAIWRRHGHRVLVASREKECLTQLLDELGIDHVCLSRRSRGLAGLGWELLRRDVKMLQLSWRFKPDVFVGRFALSASHAGFLTRRPCVVFEDTEHARLQQRLSLPFASMICSTTSYMKDWGPRQQRYDSIDHLAYTHPRYFRSDAEALRQAGLAPGEPYSLLRLVSWEAAHDRGVQGLSCKDVGELVACLRRSGRVMISCEGALPAELEAYRITIPAGMMLSLLAGAHIYVGEGGSMASEAACLGVPAVYVNRLQVGYLRCLQEEYGLVRCVQTAGQAIQAVEQMLAQGARHYQDQRKRLLVEKIDVTQYVVDLVEKIGG